MKNKKEARLMWFSANHPPTYHYHVRTKTIVIIGECITDNNELPSHFLEVLHEVGHAFIHLYEGKLYQGYYEERKAWAIALWVAKYQFRLRITKMTIFAIHLKLATHANAMIHPDCSIKGSSECYQVENCDLYEACWKLKIENLQKLRLDYWRKSTEEAP